MTTIGEGAFAFCRSLAGITIPGNVTTIEGGAFADCKVLSNIIIPDSVTTIGASAFEYSGLTGITLSDNVTSIGKQAFEYCKDLVSITIPASVTSIGDYAFNNCTSLERITFLGGEVSMTGPDTFRYCYTLKTVEVIEGSTTHQSCMGKLGGEVFQFITPGAAAE